MSDIFLIWWVCYSLNGPHIANGYRKRKPSWQKYAQVTINISMVNISLIHMGFFEKWRRFLRLWLWVFFWVIWMDRIWHVFVDSYCKRLSLYSYSGFLDDVSFLGVVVVITLFAAKSMEELSLTPCSIRTSIIFSSKKLAIYWFDAVCIDQLFIWLNPCWLVHGAKGQVLSPTLLYLRTR